MLLFCLFPASAFAQCLRFASSDTPAEDIGFLTYLSNAVTRVAHQFWQVVLYIINPGEKVFWLYLISSLLCAMYVYLRLIRREHNSEVARRGFLQFLFPKEVWSHKSAWLDVRYFFFHQMLRLVIYGTFTVAISKTVFDFTIEASSTALGPDPFFDLAKQSAMVVAIVSFAYMFASAALSDFVSYCIHYVQHKNKFLWEFHKVHHSAEVLHPLSNYREHPIDNLFYAVGLGLSIGFATGMIQILLGYVPTNPQVLGVTGILFVFYFLGYNLRHSHIWLRWPGLLAYLFGCPAHHQIHHSYHPDHINKNFAFLFPFWDALFGTFCLPQTDEDVSFGLAEDHEPEYESCLGVYFIPLQKAFKDLFSRRKQ
jgi:sterol desaturase/sphingolipid hydroxylase (fatty acid hydroxylase superfamily)